MADEPLFNREDELCDTLSVDRGKIGWNRRARSQGSPTPTKARLEDYLPGQPRVALASPGLANFLESEFETPDLNQLSPHLWLVAKQDSSHISSLTDQIVKGRKIVITEKPGLHLTWIYDRVYIKPLPEYLLCYDFWSFYLLDSKSPIAAKSKEKIALAALGFLRSYAYLIRHKSDFALATTDDNRLIPSEISFPDFIQFIKGFEDIGNDRVAPRYSFGELRLSRLNFWAKIFLRRFTYHRVHREYGAYFARSYGPILFVFAVFSVLLNAMQVALSAEPLVQSGSSWELFAFVSRGFSVFTIVCAVLICALLFAALVLLASRETIFATKGLIRERRKGSADVEHTVAK